MRCLTLRLSVSVSYLSVVQSALICPHLIKCELRLTTRTTDNVHHYERSYPPLQHLSPLLHPHTLKLAAPIAEDELQLILSSSANLRCFALQCSRPTDSVTLRGALRYLAKYCPRLRALELDGVL